MSKYIGWQLLVAVGFCIALSGALAADFPLVRNGKPVATIVLPATTELQKYLNATPQELEAFVRSRLPNSDDAEIQAALKKLPTFRAAEAKRVGDEESLAADELQSFVQKISGAKLEIVRWKPDEALPAGPAILLGAELARKAGFGSDLDRLDQDGILLKVKGNFLVLSGRRARGTLYAAYDFLESLGCRWIMPGPFGEFYSEKPTLATAVDKIENPSFSKRYWWCTAGPGKEYAQWTLRNKGDFVRALGDSVIAQGHALAFPLRQGARDTGLAITVRESVRQAKKGPDGKPLKDDNGKPIYETVEKDIKRLPDDYYSLADGKPNVNCPNISNPVVGELYAKCYRDYFGKDHPFDDYVSMSIEDGPQGGIDERPASRALDSNEYDWTIGTMSATDRIMYFYNRNIAAVTKQYPGRRFGLLVYSNMMTPPRIEHVNPAMALVLAPLGICPIHDIRDAKCKTNRAYRQWLEDWMAQANAVGAETYNYDYDPIGFSWNHFMICPQWPIIGRNYPWLHKLGLTGHTSQGHDDWGATGLNHWLMIRLYWNVNQDYHDIIRDYCQIRFGAAAEAMVAYYAVLEKRMDEVPDLVSNEIWGNHLILTREVRAKCREAMARAVKLADTDRARAQLATAEAIQRSTDAFCDGIEYARETGDFGGAAAKLKPAFAVADDLNKLYSHFVQPKNTSRDDHVPFRPGGWMNKYIDWDRKIKSSAASVVLPRTGKIALDTDNLAWMKGWQNPAVSVADLPDGDSTLIPDITFKTDRDPAAFFYRFDVDVPASFASAKKTVLYFPSLIARAFQMWINGTPVEFDTGGVRSTTWHGPPTFWYDYNHQHEFDVTGLLKPGAKNTIAFRVYKCLDHGGSYDRIFLLADPPS